MAKTAPDTETARESVENQSFEQAIAELEAIVRKLESGQADLDSTITDYERGMKLKTHCEAKLAQAKLKVEQIVKTSGGQISTKTFDEKVD